MKNTIIAIIISISLIASAIIFSGRNSQNKNTENQKINNKETPINNVTEIEGKQIIEIQAKGGYTPRKSIAKAGIPTILRFNTKGTFDCSSAVRIPSMNISKNLPQNGTTDIDLGINEKGILNGSCGMGMYPFEIEFQ